jgi:hypothetical protein
MMSLMLRLFLAAIVLSLLSTSTSTQTLPSQPAGQATKPPARPATRKPAERTEPAASPRSESCGIGVIVAVGDEFMLKRIGLDFFNNHAKVVPIESWGLDDLVFARVRAAIPRNVAVRRIPYSKSVKPREELTSQFFRDRKAEQVDVMRQITAGISCERYVLVGRSISKINDSNETVRGVGILDMDVPLRHKAYVFALSYVWVFDGRDFSIIRQGSAITKRDPLMQRMLLGELILGPYSEVVQASLPSQPGEIANNLALREYARALLTASLDKTLPWMLGP